MQPLKEGQSAIGSSIPVYGSICTKYQKQSNSENQRVK